ncbi:spore-associated protein A [Actinokineospora diospyrosa]|uniref:Spore-associated protein A n=1 Tax=Actinokineospora diospyrosa TaxID=103728 RepID=A0ABT1IC70_9PSEU|nr:spore-associated protein A [Actinokineospora diospyrosa]MCP2270219.1 hypothetical protein [Actinokineospora diospyrosa]
MRVARNAVAALAAVGMALGTAVLVPGVATAASYNGACGSGYGVVNRYDLIGGTVFLTYSRSSGLNCVVTVRDNPGPKLPMTAKVSRSDELTWVEDMGDYGTYAGPVYRHAAGVCVDWGGAIDSDSVTVWRTNCG